MSALTSRVLLDPERRVLFLGKIRRKVLVTVPFVAEYLQAKHGLTGGCNGCGASCQILFRCPFWDSASRLCTVYENRPKICRLFPITPADLRDRDSVARSECGFCFMSGVREEQGRRRSFAGEQTASGGS